MDYKTIILLMCMVAIFILLASISFEASKEHKATEEGLKNLNDAVSRLQASLADIDRANQACSKVTAQQQLEMDRLRENVSRYESDIKLWNSQVNEMFGAANARYFKGERK
jgi:peptidoglycan hydrolase CwlO-like protein